MIVIEQPREVGQPRRKIWCNKTDLTAQGEGYVFNDLPQDALGFGSIVFVVDEPGLVLWYDSESGEMYERVLGSGGGPSITVQQLNAVTNRTYTAPEGVAYNPVTVAVPNSYTSTDVGKVVQRRGGGGGGGAPAYTLVSQTTRNIGANGTYNTTTNNSVVVDVPNPSTGSLPIDKNGTYDVTDYAEAVVNVSGSSPTPVPSKDVDFIDYDGTIVYSYTAAEFAALTAMPANPTHEGLTAQGWNWSLSDAQDYVAKYGFLTIGQMYITSDGKTRIYIHLEEGRLEPYLGICVNGTATVDWGDGTTSTVTGSSTSTTIYTQHVYAASGDYVIAIGVVGALGLPVGNYSNGSHLLMKTSSINAYIPNTVYLNAVLAIHLGENIEIIGNSAFGKLANLNGITIPNYSITYGQYIIMNSGVTAITIPRSATAIPSGMFQSGVKLRYVSLSNEATTLGDSLFSNCYCLTRVAIPENVSSISSSMFSSCNGLASLSIPNGITKINQFSLQCGSLGAFWFYSLVPPVVDSSNVFSNVPTDCKIYVPAGSLEAYTTATNYPSSSTYTYVEY